MKGSILFLFACLGIIASILSLYEMVTNGNILFGLIILSVALISFGFSMSKFTDLNYTPKKTALNYE